MSKKAKAERNRLDLLQRRPEQPRPNGRRAYLPARASGEVRVLDLDVVAAPTPEAAALRAKRRALIERLSGGRPWG